MHACARLPEAFSAHSNCTNALAFDLRCTIVPPPHCISYTKVPN